MTTRNYSSTAVAATLTASITDTQTSITVSATTGFPAAPYILAIDAGAATQELVLVTAVAGTTLTVTRGYDSTSGQAHATGASVVHSHAAIDLRDSRTHEAGTSGVHGVTGSVVGTTDTQTLTNKTIGSSNTINGFTASKVAVTDASGNLVAGTSAPPTGAVVGTTDAQTLTNKTIALAGNTVSGTLAEFNTAVTDDDLTGAAAFNAHTAATAAHGATGAVVGTTNTQTLTNKTLTSPTINTPAISNPTLTGAVTMNSKIQSGVASVSLSASNTGTATVTFGTAFASAPHVVGTSANADLTVGISSVSTTGFTITLYRAAGATTFTGSVTWIAVV